MLFKSEYKNKLVKIFVPIMLSNLIAQIQMLIDRIFLGRMDILYMSAVGNATAPMWTTMSFVFSMAIYSHWQHFLRRRLRSAGPRAEKRLLPPMIFVNREL